MSRNPDGENAFIFPPQLQPAIPIEDSDLLFPVHRIFCVGRNYVEHAKEMGVEIDREAPFYFLKPATALIVTPATIPYPQGTKNFHYEVELVVALGGEAFNLSADRVHDIVFGYAVGLDMTRRDLQLEARGKGRPWDTGKAVERSAVIAPVVAKDAFGAVGDQAITLDVNGVRKQTARISDLVWSVPELISHLSTLYRLGQGDLIYTGTPAGVGPVIPGDMLHGQIEGLPSLTLNIAEAQRV